LIGFFPVAAAGYITVRSIDEHAAHVNLPRKFAFVFVLVSVIAFGVLWEVLEFVLAEAAGGMGGDPALTQHGLGHTMLEPVFGTIGAIVVATWATVRLTNLSRVCRANHPFYTTRRLTPPL
jgi:uncharacterized membrane protein YjdF